MQIFLGGGNLVGGGIKGCPPPPNFKGGDAQTWSRRRWGSRRQRSRGTPAPSSMVRTRDVVSSATTRGTPKKGSSRSRFLQENERGGVKKISGPPQKKKYKKTTAILPKNPGAFGFPAIIAFPLQLLPQDLQGFIGEKTLKILGGGGAKIKGFRRPRNNFLGGGFLGAHPPAAPSSSF